MKTAVALISIILLSGTVTFASCKNAANNRPPSPTFTKADLKDIQLRLVGSIKRSASPVRLVSGGGRASTYVDIASLRKTPIRSLSFIDRSIMGYLVVIEWGDDRWPFLVDSRGMSRRSPDPTVNFLYLSIPHFENIKPFLDGGYLADVSPGFTRLTLETRGFSSKEIRRWVSATLFGSPRLFDTSIDSISVDVEGSEGIDPEKIKVKGRIFPATSSPRRFSLGLKEAVRRGWNLPGLENLALPLLEGQRD